MKKKIYFIAESVVDGKTIHSEKFNQFINPETGKTIFDDVFLITDYEHFQDYKDKEDFINIVYGMAYNYFSMFGEDIGEITVTAVDEKTDILQWGVKIKPLNDIEFEYAVMDWKGDGYIFKIEN